MFPNISSRVLNTPLLIEPRKAHAFLLGLGERLFDGPVAFDDDFGEPEAEDPTKAPAFASLIGGELADSLIEHRVGYGLVEGVAIIPISGVLVHRGGYVGESSGVMTYEGIGAQIEAVMADSEVRAVAFEVNSYGGEVAGMHDLADRIRAIDLPTRAFVSENAYSAAYGLASQSDQIVIPRTGGVGSIGVLIIHASYEKLLAKAGITMTMIHAGARKVDGNPYQALPDAVRAGLEEEVEDLRKMFAKTVGEGRGEALTAEAALATEAAGFTGQKAIDAGLADILSEPRAGFEAWLAELDQPSGAITSARGAQPKGVADMRGKKAKRAKGQVDDQEDQAMEEDDDDVDAEDTDDDPEAESDEDDAQAMEDDEEDEDGDDDAAPAAARERARIKAILTLPEAKGREEQASYLAFETSRSVKEAKKDLARSAKKTRLGDAMKEQGTQQTPRGGGEPKRLGFGAKMKAKHGTKTHAA